MENMFRNTKDGEQVAFYIDVLRNKRFAEDHLARMSNECL
jgi:hypothetical protein